MTIMLANTKIKNNKLVNFPGAMSYMETKVTEFFRVAKDNKNQGRGGKRIRILSVEVHGRGRGSIGQGHGLGRGRVRGHSNGLFFNQVDFQDFKQNFHPIEMEYRRSEVNYYITQNYIE